MEIEKLNNLFKILDINEGEYEDCYTVIYDAENTPKSKFELLSEEVKIGITCASHHCGYCLLYFLMFIIDNDIRGLKHYLMSGDLLTLVEIAKNMLSFDIYFFEQEEDISRYERRDDKVYERKDIDLWNRERIKKELEVFLNPLERSV